MVYETSDQTKTHKTSTSSFNIDQLGRTNEKRFFVEVAPMEVTPCKTASVFLIVEALRTKKT